MDHELATPKFTSECTTAYIATIRGFIADGIVNHLARIRRAHGMFEALHHGDECAGANKAFVDNMVKVTKSQLLRFLHLCCVKYVKARIEPGM